MAQAPRICRFAAVFVAANAATSHDNGIVAAGNGGFAMRSRTMIGLAACAVASMTVAAGSASAQGKIQVGTLTCKGAGGVGMIVASQKSFRCKYDPEGRRRSVSFNATMSRIGVDVGVTGDTTIVWAVLASSTTFEPRALAGDFAGASADASLAVGGGANVLVGGSNNSVSLQPLSFQGQTGLNLAVGVSSLSLRQVR